MRQGFVVSKMLLDLFRLELKLPSIINNQKTPFLTHFSNQDFFYELKNLIVAHSVWGVPFLLSIV